MQRIVFGMAAALCLAAPLATMAAPAAIVAEATLAVPVDAAKRVVIDGRAWACEGQKCTADNPGRSQPVVRECTRVARELGELTAYRSGDRVLSADELRACNR